MAIDANELTNDDILLRRTLLERLGYVKQLVFSRTKLEFKLLWNKVFQKEDDELSWLLNPYGQSTSRAQATMMTSFNRNTEDSYQYSYDDVSKFMGREKVTIYNRGIVRKGDVSHKKKEEKKSFTDNALEIARYMGMGAYMTSTSLPSPFFPVNDHYLYVDETIYEPQNMYSIGKIW